MAGFLPPGAREDYVSLGGGRVRILRGGESADRAPMLLLHGGGSNAAITWYRTFAQLSARRSVIAPDLPGHGGTTGIEPIGGGATQAEFVARVMSAVGLSNAIVAGNSMGGEIALNLALHHPEVTRALVLVSPSGLLPSAGNPLVQGMAWLTTRLPERLLVGINRRNTRATDLGGIVHDSRQLPPELVAEYRRETQRPESALAFVRQTRASVGRRRMINNLLPDVGRIGVPTLFVQGADDPIVAPDTTRRAVERMSGARRVVVPDCGHWAQLEAPEVFLAAVDQFLDEL